MGKTAAKTAAFGPLSWLPKEQLFGGIQRQGQAELYRPEQLQGLMQLLSPQGPYGQFMQGGTTPEEMQKQFQTSVVDPSMLQYKQQVLPSIQERFVGQGAGSSSALSQALASSAQDLQTSLAGQYLPFMQGQQQTQLGALGQYGGLLGQKTFDPLYMQHPGILGDLMKILTTAGVKAAF